MASKVVILSAATIVVGAAVYGCVKATEDDDETAYCVRREGTGDLTSPTPTPDPFGSPTPTVGTDGSHEVVSDSLCDDDDDYHSSHGSYFWYYGGRLTGNRISGGSTVRPDGSIKTRSGRTIQRGGFGGRSGRSGG